MKKFLILFAVLILSALAAVMVAACKGDKEHKHEYGDYTLVRAASCSEEGEEVRYCKVCNEPDTRTIAKLPHTEVVSARVDATCTADGHTAGKHCSVCGTVLEGETLLPKLGHDWQTVEEVKATCTVAGYKKSHCERCNTDVEENFDKLPHTYEEGWKIKEQASDGDGHVVNGKHYRVCSVCSEEDVMDCVYTTETHRETCTEDGYHIHVCALCSNSMRHADLPASGHNYGAAVYDGLKYEEGQYVAYHRYVCKNGCNEDKVEKCVADEGVVVEATCTAAGYTLHECAECKNQTRTDPVPVKDHSYGEPQPVTNMSPWHHRYTCETCGATKTERCTEERVDVKQLSCETPYTVKTVCTVCERASAETVVYAPLTHDWTNYEYDPDKYDEGTQTGYHTRYCRRAECGKIDTQPCDEEESSKVATCLDAGSVTSVCRICKNSHTEAGDLALGHSYPDEWETVGHGKGASHQKVCERCGDVYSEECKFTEYHTDPDCVTDGIDIYRCEACSNEYNEVLPKLGHQWRTVYVGGEDVEEWIVDETRHSCDCLRCGHWETGEHTFVNSNLCDICGYDALEYRESGAEYVVYSGRHLSGVKEIIIPAEHNGRAVTAIAPAYTQGNGSLVAFYSMQSIEKVTLPASIKTIGKMAFQYCEKLKEVVIDLGEEGELTSQLVTIEPDAFSSCKQLLRVHLPKTVTSIGARAFQYCSKLYDINIDFDAETAENNIVDIGEDAFSDTAFYNDKSHWSGDALYIGRHLIVVDKNHFIEKGVEQFEVKADTVTISSRAFKDCAGMKKIILPAGLKEVGKDAFKGCNDLHEVAFGGKFADWLSIKFENDEASPMAYASVLNIEGAVGNIEIPEGATAIPAGAFKGTAITGVTIHSGVVSIGEEAFENCASLTTVTVEGNVNYIGANAFDGTPFYNNPLNWTDGILYVGNCAVTANEGEVAGVEVPTQAVLRAGTIAIAVNAFKDNTHITSLTVPETVTYVGSRALTGMTNLQSVTFQSPDNWFMFSHKLGIGRVHDITPETIMGYINTYDNYWRKTAG